MTIRIIRSKEYFNFQTFQIDLAKEVGLEKAIIIYSLIDRKAKKDENIHERFPYLIEKKVYKYLREIIKDGILCEDCFERMSDYE